MGMFFARVNQPCAIFAWSIARPAVPRRRKAASLSTLGDESPAR
ncbi:hypothetical protein GGQ96_002960 [Sphingomonas abaci]|uniref:Uncharacterized protein n=1 Tax=Sphingomonas abaci TaxID=237611 RepID=A0A7W7EZ80_9SPHN|nr:hypothetical protein [Sphingomonas abaci]